MRILVTTDAHGFNGVSRAHTWAIEEEADALLILGDVWEVNFEGRLPIHAIRGNHEKLAYEPLWDRGRGKGGMVLHGDYATFELEGVRFGVLGRMDEEAHAHLNPVPRPPKYGMLPPGTSWLGDARNRAFERRDVDEVANLFAGCDVLLFHDAPAPYVYGDGRSARDEGGSPYLAAISRAVRPDLVFHGHVHERRNRILPGTEVPIRGLPPCDPSFGLRDYDVVVLTDGLATLREA